MTEAEAKRIIVDDPGGNIARRLDALEVAFAVVMLGILRLCGRWKE